MKKPTRFSASTAISSLLFLAFALPALAAAPAAGDLVKLADDGNAATTADSSVYYVGANATRYAFPGSKSYFTWYKDFVGVKILTAAELAALRLSGNVMYRPGTRLIKITTDPKVYAVEPGGVLRPIASEAIASALFGATWNKQIDDLPDEYFFDYVIGAPLDTATFPDGSVVRRSSDQALFLIDNGQKRRIGTDAAKTALRVQDAFIRATSENLGAYADGAAVTGAESYADTAQQSVRIGAVPTFSFLSPAVATFPVPGDAAFATLRLTAGARTTLTKLTLKVSALKNEPIDYGTKGFDDDAGGIVRGFNAQLNLYDIRLVDEAGTTVMDTQTFTLDQKLDQEQIITFTGHVDVPVGGAVWQIRVRTDEDIPLSEPYGVTVAHAFTTLLDAAGAPAAFLPAGDLVSPKMTTARGTLEVKAASQPASATVVRGAKDVAISGHVFQAPASAAIIIHGITYTGLIDEREPGSSGYSMGIDSDNGTSTALNDIVPEVWLTDDKGNLLAGPASVEANGTVEFKGLSLAIPAGASLTLVVHGAIDVDAALETVSNRLLFDIEDAETDVSATDVDGFTVDAVGKWPLGGVAPKSYLTVAEVGTLDLNWVGFDGDIVGGREDLLGRLDLTAKDDDFTLQILSLKNNGSTTAALGDLRVEYLTKEGVKTSVAGVALGDTVTFTGLGAYVVRGKTSAVSLYGRPYSRENGVVSGSKIALSLQTGGPLQFTSASSVKTYDETSLGNGFFKVGTNTPTAKIVRWTSIAVQKSAELVPSASYADAETPALGFVVKAGAEGGARISKLTFRLTPSDHGLSKTVGGVTVTSDNDALERWADLNGDFADDDQIIALYQIIGTTKTLIGEGADGSIRYSIGTDETPAGKDSGGSDYGRIVITFPGSGGIGIAAGSEATFLLRVATDALDDAKDYTLSTQLMGGNDFGWHDSYFNGETVLPGDEEYGFPISSPVTVRH